MGVNRRATIAVLDQYFLERLRAGEPPEYVALPPGTEVGYASNLAIADDDSVIAAVNLPDEYGDTTTIV